MALEPAYVIAALVCGLVAIAARLPPLLGFLLAGFILNVAGYDSTPVLEVLADLGVTLLLFTIGLKLNIRFLLQKPVWAAATLHLAGTTLLFALLLMLLARGLAWPLLAELEGVQALLLGFALSFSSTVFVVKALEERSEAGSFYGRVAIGVLVMQDVFAVAFMAASTGALPSPWALGLFLLIPLAPLLQRLLERVGHGELQVLYGIALALVLGYSLFEALGVKGDLGALFIGMLLAPHPSASPLAKSLFNLKELFLICFFLSLGLGAELRWELAGVALLLLALLPLKSLLYLLIFTRFRMRLRSSLLSTLSLSNYSEFGLILGAAAVAQGLLANDWLTVMALAVAASFVIAAPLNSASEAIYRRFAPRLRRLESRELLPHDSPIQVDEADAVVLGMGRIGHGAYLQLTRKYGMRVLGIENRTERVQAMRAEGLNVVEGDGVDSDFWDKLVVDDRVRLVLLTMPGRAGNLHAIQQLRRDGFHGQIAAAVNYADEINLLKRAGADAVFHVSEEAGSGLVEHAFDQLPQRPATLTP